MAHDSQTRLGMLQRTAMLASAALILATGCESVPTGTEPQSTGPAATQASVVIPGKPATTQAEHAFGSLINGALGPGGGYLIGIKQDALRGSEHDQIRDQAIRASQRAEKNPVRTEDVDRARTADLNADGFVTLDEVVAMRQANLGDAEILQRLTDAGDVFDLSDYQETYLRDRGVSDKVIHQLRTTNQDFARADDDRDRL